jgi:hypothetical protein
VTGWADLERELDAWGAAGLSATFWWRDDDAGTDAPTLIRLLALASRLRVPLALAAIPAKLAPAAAERLRNRSGISVLQHGWSHDNRALPGEKKAEFAANLPLDAALSALAAGQARLSGQVGARALRVLVPPWNRIDPALIAHLSTLGFKGLSTYGARRERLPADSVVQANCHCDPIDWHGTRGFLGLASVLEVALAHLEARRLNQVDATEPSGLLTHHLAHDEPTWSFLEQFLARTKAHPAVRWLDAEAVFAA